MPARAGPDGPHYRTVKTILSSGAERQPLLVALSPAAYGRARFTRSGADLFAGDSPADATVH